MTKNDILRNILEGNNIFDCEAYGQKIKCEILSINFEMQTVTVKFDRPIKKTIRRSVPCHFSNGSDEYTFTDEEITVLEGRLSFTE